MNARESFYLFYLFGSIVAVVLGLIAVFAKTEKR